MQYLTKNKWIMALLLLLLLANIITIAAFWLQRPPQPQAIMKERPDAFLTKELALGANQQKAYQELVKEHQQNVAALRNEIKSAKDNFFKLLQEPTVADSIKIAAAKKASEYIEQIDLITFDHFKKLRAICNPDQQKKFDNIIAEVMRMIATSAPEQNRQRPGPPDGPLGRRQGSPPPPGEGPPPPPER